MSFARSAQSGAHALAGNGICIYRASSQYRLWSYTEPSLQSLRATTNAVASERVAHENELLLWRQAFNVLLIFILDFHIAFR
jgi:hypothetical protein